MKKNLALLFLGFCAVLKWIGFSCFWGTLATIGGVAAWEIIRQTTWHRVSLFFKLGAAIAGSLTVFVVICYCLHCLYYTCVDYVEKHK